MTNLYNIGQWYKDKGLVGEIKLALVTISALVADKPLGIGIIAAAGSGKTVVMDKTVGDEGEDDVALIEQKYIYFKDSASNTAMWYDQEKINNAKIFVLKELQKDKSHDAIEMIKSLTEGKSARRKVTDVTTDGVKEQKIKPMPCFFSLAVENDTKTDAELSRRCITMNTDVSQQQTAKVLELKAMAKFNHQSFRCLTDEESNAIRMDVNFCFMQKFKVINPFAPAFAKLIAEIAPDQKARSMMDHFWDVMEGVVKINALSKPFYVGPQKTDLLATIQDLYQTLDIYLDSFIRDLYGIPPMGDIVLQGFNDATKALKENIGSKKNSGNLGSFVGLADNAGDYFSVTEVREAIRRGQNVNLTTKVVNDICRQLVDAGYLADNRDNKTITYKIQDEFKQIAMPDFDAMLSSAVALVKDAYPEIFDKWYAHQHTGYEHPLTGQRVLVKEEEDDGIGLEDLC